MKISIKVMLEAPALWLVVATLAVGSAGEGLCERRRTWWDRERGACAPCTRCEPHRAVKFPCELHRDTVCQPINEIHIFPFTSTNNDSYELDDYVYDEYSDYGEVSDDTDDGVVRWDVQTTTLALAASGCVMFFVVVLYLSFYHAKQWKMLKKTLRSDVQDLSAKLKLMEAGETPAEPVVPSDHHIYCNIHVAKDALLGPVSSKKGLGNVYTQEKHPS